jgi:Flp pilus assembly protein TadG
MRRGWTRIVRDERGAAAAEMALALPFFFALMFGSFELGKYFLDEHVVIKAARDAARYASRSSFADFTCTAVDPARETAIKNVARTGQVATGGTARLAYWTSDTTITVSVACNTSGTYQGIYRNVASGVPVVTVAIRVPYDSLFGQLGIGVTGIAIAAQSQAAVMGL